MFFLISKKLAWVDLPGVWTAALLALAFLARRRRVLSGALVLVACVTLVVMASPRTVNILERALTASGGSTMKPGLQYDVAVVLSDGWARLEAGADVVRRDRARYLLYSGASRTTDAAVLSADLALGVPADRFVLETRSRNTRENAVESARIIAAHSWRSVLLVTSATHVERAVGCFHRVGLRPDVLAVADLPPLRDGDVGLVALQRSSELLHELIGGVVYRLVGYSEG